MWEKILPSVLLAAAASAAGAPADTTLKRDLEQVVQLRIFFGHQSVGDNLLDGMRKLAREAGVSLNVQQVRSAGSVPAATLGHAYMAENGNPQKKFESFTQAMEAPGKAVDVALVKICYVDFSEQTDAQRLFARYRTTLEALRAKHPQTVFVHVTAPLTTVQSGPKAFVKRLLGRAPYGTLENLRREEYNTLLRRTYAGKEPVFDLARVESTDPDGKAVTVLWQGSAAPALVDAFTDDGSHLNDAGRLRAARELISVLAAVQRH